MITKTLAVEQVDESPVPANENEAPRTLDSCLADMRAALIRYAVARHAAAR